MWPLQLCAAYYRTVCYWLACSWAGVCTHTHDHAILCHSRSVIQTLNGFFKLFFSICALWYGRWFVLILWPRRGATGNFCAWRVPPHNDARKHNLISTFIYRTDCSNGVITICCHAPSLPPTACSPAACRPFSGRGASEAMQMRTSEQMNVSWMLFMMGKCKWGWSEWMNV